MTQEELNKKVLRLIENAELSLKAAKALLRGEEEGTLQNGSEFTAPQNSEAATSYEEGDHQIVEGYFDGQNMIGPNEKIYPVPANYASKSKLVEGDRLKLTIMPNGSFLYKQIAPVDRIPVKGTLINEDGQYKVIANGKNYRVLLASVTYYKGQAGDEITLLIPKYQEADWAAIEAVLPQMGSAPVDSEDQY